MKNLNLGTDSKKNMVFKTDAYTDKGIKKEVNQDALIIKQARTEKRGKVCFACLCDGMGGLSLGEVASSSFIDRMERWFNEDLPSVLSPTDITVRLDSTEDENDCFKLIQSQWNQIVQQMNYKLKKYGEEKGLKLGTTAVAIFFMSGKYITMAVGDTRAYCIDGSKITQITHDHSYVQRQIDLGYMTKSEAETSKQKSVLLQCRGASEKGNMFQVTTKNLYDLKKDDTVFMCSDGLWRKLSDAEIIKYVDKAEGIKSLAEIVKQRGETDNISGLMVKV